MSDLAIHVQSLPQELYDKLYDEVFTAPTSDVSILVDKANKPPVQLQVDRASREQFAHSYYGNNYFVVINHIVEDYNSKPDFILEGYLSGSVFLPWLASLPRAHLWKLHLWKSPPVRFVITVDRRAAKGRFPSCSDDSAEAAWWQGETNLIAGEVDADLLRQFLPRIVLEELRVIDYGGSESIFTTNSPPTGRRVSTRELRHLNIWHHTRSARPVTRQ